MFKKAYAVVVDSYIDGGAPGYYAVAICETQEEADKIKSFVNSCLNTIKNSKIGTRKRWEATRYLEKFDNYEISFGYNEGADSDAYIKELTLPTAKAGGILASKRTAPKVTSYTLSTSVTFRVPHGSFYSSS